MASDPVGLQPDSLTLYTAGALLSTWLQQYHYGGQAELASEVLCWLLLFAWFEGLPAFGFNWRATTADRTGQVGLYPWIIAFSLGLASFGKSLQEVRWILPALTPALLTYRRFFPRDGSTQTKRSLPWYIGSIPAQAAVAMISILVLASFAHVKTIGIAVLTFVALLGVYISLINVLDDDYNLEEKPMTTKVVQVIFMRVLPWLIILSILRVFVAASPVIPVSTFFISGLLKTAHWLFMFQVTQSAPWDIATTITTFSVASSLHSTEVIYPLRAVGYLFTAIIALLQTISFIPKFSRSHYVLLVFILCPMLGLLRTGVVSRGSQILNDHWPTGQKETTPISGTPVTTPSTPSPGTSSNNHPIELLIQNSKAEFNAMLERQSKTLTEAEAEYKKRYKLDPPPGFDKWFNFAKEKESPIIDEFNSIYESMAPFYAIAPATLRQLMDQATTGESISKCGYKGGKFTGNCGNYGNDLQKVLGSMQSMLPDVDILMNAFDEPRLLISNDPAEATQHVLYQYHSSQNSWKEITAPCAQQSKFVEGLFKPTVQKDVFTHGLPFIQDARNSKDVCKHPEYADIHGFFVSPATLKFTKQAPPILSQAKPSTFGDILFPIPWYANEYEKPESYSDSQDPDWDKKYNELYWAGSNTGSQDTDGSWHKFARQRFVSLARHLENGTATFLTEGKPGVWEPYQSQDVLRALYDAKFTAIIQCTMAECQAQKDFFHPDNRASANMQFQHKFVMDLDGNSYSGRYYNHLRSKSVSLKMTIFREWHDERLYPWIHYVPVSLTLEELPETMRYLALTEAGMKYSKEIADQGRDWWSKVLRREDFQIYFYRLALELARLLDDSRPIIKNP